MQRDSAIGTKDWTYCVADHPADTRRIMNTSAGDQRADPHEQVAR